MVSTQGTVVDARLGQPLRHAARSHARNIDSSAEQVPVRSDSVVEIENVSINYTLGTGRRQVIKAVEDVSVSIRRGEKLIILGPSGCGKSTLLMALGGFIPISGGTMKVNGRPVSRPSMERIMVFQDFNQLLPWMTVIENVQWGIRKRHPKMNEDEVRRRATRQVDLVGLARQAQQFPNTLSGGQKQRCAIARSFAATPEILLMDEPFGALDAINRERMQQELNNIWSEQESPTTIAFVTHDVAEAVLLGHRIMVMTNGPGRVRAIVENNAVGRSADDPEFMELCAQLRELLKEEIA